MPLQDEMEGLDLEGKMHNDGVDLIEKLLSALWSLEFSSTIEPDDDCNSLCRVPDSFQEAIFSLSLEFKH